MKSKGVTNSYKNESGYDPDTRVIESPQVITLDKSLNDVEQKDEQSGITVSAPGITGVKVTVNSVPNYDAEKYSVYASYDIRVDGYTKGTTAKVSVPAPSSFDKSKDVLVLYAGEVIAKVPIVNDKITFTTNHFSVYDIAQLAEEEVDNWVEIPGETRYTYTQASSITANGKYVIVGNSHDVALVDNNGSMGAQSVTISNSTITTDTKLPEWTFSDSSSGTVYNGTHYLRYSSNAFGLNTSSGTLNFSTSGSSFRIYYSRFPTSYSFYYNGSSWTTSSWNSTQNVRLYQLTDTTVTPSTYVGMTGQTTYYMATGKYSNQAAVEEMIKNNITVYTAADATGKDAVETTDYQLNGTVDPNNAGTYSMTVTYGGKTLGNITINVSDKTATNIVIEPMEGSVERGSKGSTQTGSIMTVTYDDDTTDTIPVTVDMLIGDNLNIKKNGTYTGLSISYAGITVEGYTLKVVDVAGDNYPTYPNGGSVNVDKTATGQDFQNTGVARVNLSVSGLPSQKGIDLVVVIDTSSSMRTNYVGNTGKRRIEVLSESLEKMLTNLKKSDANGVVPDIDIAIIDFNGYSTPVSGASLNNTNRYTSASDLAKVFTGANAGEEITEVGLSAADFVDISDIDASATAGLFNSDTCKSGTNYDSALKNTYKLLSDKMNSNTEDRDQFVIFLSDGAPFRYNGYEHGVSDYDLWSMWLEGQWADVDELSNANLNYTNFPGSHPEFYNGQVTVTNGTAQPHRTAEAIKGEVNKKYDVVVESAESTGYIEKYNGLDAEIYSIGFGLADDTVSNTSVTVNTQKNVLDVLSSGSEYYYPDVQNAEELDDAFNQIVNDIRYAAQNAVFKDQMGSAFNLQMNPNIKDSSGNIRNNISTDITVTTYPVYTIDQVGTNVNGHTVTENDVGKTYGEGTLLERVTFTAGANGSITANSNKKDGNILVDGVICANTFWYNTSNAIKMIDVNGDEVAETPLDSETFYWNIGIINEKQFTLSYAVYLTGSMEGLVAEDSYDTNNYATLSYTNWLGNDASQSVPSPTMPWGGANVSYAFYLVNAAGQPVDASGNVVSNISTAYKLTQPILYKSIKLNAEGNVSSIETVAENVLPNGYTLYDQQAKYSIRVASGTGSSNWTIEGNYPQSTYITGYGRSQDYSNEAYVSDSTYDYTHTTVYFAVVWSVGTVQDTVVIDYGLPVDVSVMANDMFGSLGKLVAVGPYTEGMENTHTDTLNADFSSSYGNAKVGNYTVRYTPDSMEMNEPVVLAYAVQYTGETNTGYYYGKLTVIPATTVYFEDSFLTLESYTDNVKDENTAWKQAGATVDGATQGEDRPGEYSRPEYDANNIYGYDGAYANMSTYSMGSAAMIHVDANSYGTASFTFYGTGFDVISMTSNTTGVMAVQVRAAEQIGDIAAGKMVKSVVVNTYYGYDYGLYNVTYKYTNGTWIKTVGDAAAADAAERKAIFPENPVEGLIVEGIEHAWVAVPDVENSLYQVPVMKIKDLAYGKYTVKITATYASSLDKTTDDGYDLYLDAIRIYDPTGNQNETANSAYVADGEGWPVYEELRNNVINVNSFNISGSETVSGIVFIDGNANVDDLHIDDYKSFGPNNELYLAQGQAIAFNINAGDKVADIQLGMKAVGSGSVTYTINGVEKTVSTNTDMYYSIKDYASNTIVIQNVSGGILSLTNIKITHTEDPASGVEAQNLLWIDGPTATYALMSLCSEPTVEVFEPEKLEVSLKKSQVTVGDKVRATVKTSDDVAYITVNGKTFTDYSTNRRTGERTWSVNLIAEAVGELNVEVVAYSAEDVASQSVVKTVTVVEKKTPADIIKGLLDNIFGWLF